MNFLKKERETLESFLPELDGTLQALPLMELERRGNPGLSIFRDASGPALLIPEKYGGGGSSAPEAIRIQRAIGSRAPSLSIAATMHSFSVATLVEYSFYGDYTDELLSGIAQGQLLISSGFAEGRTGAGILDPKMKAEAVDGGYQINGSKKPCSLSHSMDMMVGSVGVKSTSDGSMRRAVVVVPADSPGISRQPFWKSTVLTGAESEELIMENVFVQEDFLFFPEVEEGIDAVELGGFLWFELLISASYLGIASGLVEKALATGKGEPGDRVQLVIELEGAMAALEGIAHMMAARERTEALLVQTLLARFAVQQAIARATERATELLGGMAFINSPDVAYLLAASRALAFHPPSRCSVSESLNGYIAGGNLKIF